MSEITRFAVKAPLLVAASVALPVLGMVTLPVTLPVGLLWAKRTNDLLKEVEETGQEGVASLIAPLAGLLVALPVLGFVGPVMLWRDAIATLQGEK